jgi:hypothetical protein
MEKMNIKKHINLLIYALVGILMFSCSGEESIPASGGTEQEVSLSVLLNTQQNGTEKSSGNQDTDAESKIYSLEVLIFKSGGEPEEGKIDGYGYVARTTRAVTGQTYEEYIEIDEIKEIVLTAGKRDIYVIANAPDRYFSSVENIQEFWNEYENLSTQGLCAHPGNVTSDPDEELPIGGLNPSGLKTNLTMCNYVENVLFSNQHKNHYLGYTTNDGRPENVAHDYGYALDGTNPFLLERLAARIAVQKIDFEFPAEGLLFESGFDEVTDYTYQIDSVFMLNVKTTSKFAVNCQPGFTEKFGHGCEVGYSFLNTPACLSNLYPQSQHTDYLVEAITTPNYDITVNATPLWFYTFENEDSNYPTYIVIGVKYNFKSAKDNSNKTVKSYYAVPVNPPGTGKQADHDYIKRNYQYRITAKIKGLGSLYGNNPVLLKSLQATDQDIEVTETVGRNLFPWTGNTYR